MKPPPARSRTRLSLIGVPWKAKPSRSLASGSLAMVSWYLIERACFSEISALSRSPAKRCGLAGQHGDVMPGIVDRLASTVAAGVFRHDAPVLADRHAIRIGMDVDRPANGAGVHRVFVVVEPHQAGLRHRGRQRVEAVEPAAIRDELRPLLLERLPHGLLRTFRMGMHLGVTDTFIGQPGVQLIIGFDPQAWREEALPHQTDLVLNLALLPARCRRAGNRIHQVMRTHLQEAAVSFSVSHYERLVSPPHSNS